LYLARTRVLGYDVSCSDEFIYNFPRIARNNEEFSPVMSAPDLNQSKQSVGLLFFAAIALSIFCSFTYLTAQSPPILEPGPKPADVFLEWKQLVGIYSDEDSKHSFVLLEQGGKLFWRDDQGKSQDIALMGGVIFPPSEGKTSIGHSIERNEVGNAIAFCYLNFCYVRTDAGADPSHAYHIIPSRPVETLRREALAASPPIEKGPFRKPELVELTTLNPAIHLDIRYATRNDFLGTPVYTQARAFLQRPAAEALIRALHKLQPLGYGLLIHDAYRPWYVTKIFWDATPPEGKIFVADPKEGSRHNRGCAVDLTLHDLATGKPIEMPGTYDEMSQRSFPDYPGGTSLQRWHRDLLRRAMESEGFTVYEHEWWHFDYKDWREYPILNIKFEDLHSGQGLASAQ
jgi:zinc D-Ala-D-Ala dipeptidase